MKRRTTHEHSLRAWLEEAAMWKFWHDLFRPPTEAQWSWLHERRVGQAWQALAQRFGAPAPKRVPMPRSYRAYEETFLATFEVGLPHPPCPLIESHWSRREPVTRILHENVLFYRRFGLTLRSSANETADHLRHQLEFLRYLAGLAAEAERSAPELIEQVIWARFDFLYRHVLSWVPRASAHLVQVAPGLWASQWMKLLSDCCNVSDAGRDTLTKEISVSLQERPTEIP